MRIFKNNEQMRRICNLIVALLSVLSIFTISVIFSTVNGENVSANVTYNSAVEDAKKYNSLLPNNSGNVNEESKYSSGLEAALDAWNNYNNATSFSITGFNNSTARPSIIGVGEYLIYASIRSAKWDDGGMFHEVHKYQKQGSTTFANMNEGSQGYSIDNKRYNRETKEGISLNGDYVNASYSTSFELEEEFNAVTPICYTIDETTINSCTNFSVLRIGGQIKYYNVELKMNPTASVKGYDEVIMKSGELDELPRFTSVEFKMTIDRDGNLVTFRVIENYVLKKIIEIPTVNDITFNIYGYGETPALPKPIV